MSYLTKVITIDNFVSLVVSKFQKICIQYGDILNEFY